MVTVSELRSYVEALHTEDLPELPDSRIEEDFAELHRVGELLEAERPRRLAEIDRRGLFEHDGYLSAAAWLASRFRVAWGVAREDLDPETGESLLTALRAVLDTEARSGDADDPRTPAQRRADALGEICRQWLDHGVRPSVAGERPHLTVTVAAEALRGEIGASELDHVGPLPTDTARRLACDASVMRVVMAGRSEPLDVGRRTLVVPSAVRRAVIVRDRGCRFPGCDRPQAWCDGHHVVHWADGGPTALHNLLLLCRRHHGMVHRTGGFRLELLDGRPVFRRPDGSILEEDRGPP
jgi:Domain of unknown function (DUF222)/HNH endonuclease